MLGMDKQAKTARLYSGEGAAALRPFPPPSPAQFQAASWSPGRACSAPVGSHESRLATGAAESRQQGAQARRAVSLPLQGDLRAGRQSRIALEYFAEVSMRGAMGWGRLAGEQGGGGVAGPGPAGPTGQVPATATLLVADAVHTLPATV